MSVTDWILGNTYCNITTTNSSFTNSIYLSGLVSEVMSIMGATFIILTYLVYKDLRTKARQFLLFIAISDLFNAIFYFSAHAYSLMNTNYSSCYPHKPIFEFSFCITQATFNVYFTICSLLWTIVLAFHVASLIYGKRFLYNRYINILLHTFVWGIPFLITLLALVTNNLGPGRHSVSAGWCFVSHYKNTASSSYIHPIFELLTSKIWDIITFICLVCLYTLAGIQLFRIRCNEGRFRFSEQDVKLATIPLVYFLLRIWGNIRWVIEIIQHRNTHIIRWLLFLQSIGDTGQGWANAFLFLILTKAIRDRVFNDITSFTKKFPYRKNRLLEGQQPTINNYYSC